MNTELLAWATAGGVITLFCLWMRDTRAAEPGEPIAADLRATKCKLCSHVLGVDRKWHLQTEVTFPASCRIEEVICNHCQLLASARKGGVPTGALEDTSPKLRPVFAGAETLS